MISAKNTNNRPSADTVVMARGAQAVTIGVFVRTVPFFGVS